MTLKDYFIESMLDDLDKDPDQIEQEYIEEMTALADVEVSDDRQ